MNGIWPAFSLLPHRHRTFGRKQAVFRLFRPDIRLLPYRPAPAGNWMRWSSALMVALPRPCRQSPDDPPAGRAAHGICRSQAREQFTGAVDRMADTAEASVLPLWLVRFCVAVRDSVVSVARAVWNWIFF